MFAGTSESKSAFPLKQEKPLFKGFSLVLGAGLEPARISPHAPQACVSANFTTRADLLKTAHIIAYFLHVAQGGIFENLKIFLVAKIAPPPCVEVPKMV